MCYSPITIINPSKYVSLCYRERYLLQVPCGHCSQCQTNKSNEWYFRSYYQILETFESYKNGYILFDTLTYRNEDLPHLSDFVQVPENCDYPCFSSRHIQLFNKRLRKKLDKFGSRYKFFISSEYGTSERHTHRPHYHLLLYSDGMIEPLQLSRMISEAWQYGRTDGIPYKPANYVLSNTFRNDNFASALRTASYVSKYVQKSCKFEKEIKKRLDRIMMSINDHMKPMVDDWLSSVHAKRVRQRYMRLMSQFHRQSKEFGAYYMKSVDITDFKSLSEVFIPDSKKVHLKIPLPQYYKRKFFYEVKKIDGNDTWILTDLGVQYKKFRENQLLKDLSSRFSAANHQANTNYDTTKLANYVVTSRGRICSNELLINPLDKYDHVSLYNYSTMSDREHLDRLGLSPRFAGNNSLGYRSSKLYSRISFRDFISRYVILDGDLEDQLQQLYDSYDKVNYGRQSAFELRQHLVNLYHYLNM